MIPALPVLAVMLTGRPLCVVLTRCSEPLIVTAPHVVAP